MNVSRSVTFNSTWTVTHVHFVGVAKSPCGELTNLLHFQAELRSAESTCFVEVEVDARALDRLLKRLAKGSSVHRHSENGPRPRTITKLIEELLSIDLSFDGSDRWDPVRSPHWRLEERVMSRLLEDSPTNNISERHSSPRVLTLVENIFRSTCV